MSQRLVRAKAKIQAARIPFRVPEAPELSDRLPPVLNAIYAVFAAGWGDPAEAATDSRSLGAEGLWLARLLAALLPEEPEALGLLALMLFVEARRTARRDADGRYVPLTEQDPDRWDARQTDEAESLLQRASRKGRVGRFQLEAAIQSAHAVRRHTGGVDWPAIGHLYDHLVALTGSPVAAINRAIAVAEIRGPAAGLSALDKVAADPRVSGYQPYWAARAALLGRAGDGAAAQAAYRQAIALEIDPAVRSFLRQRCSETTGTRA